MQKLVAKFSTALLVIACWSLCAVAQEREPITIFIDDFPPYIAGPDDRDAPAMRMVRLAFEGAGYEPNFVYTDYGYALKQATSGSEFTFPWRDIGDRRSVHAFSAPLFTIELGVFYNVRSLGNDATAADVAGEKVGIVTDYEFGDEVNRFLDMVTPVEFANERSAIAALLDLDIEAIVLPVPNVRTLLTEEFPREQELLAVMDAPVETFEMHVIGPATSEHRATLSRFDDALARIDNWLVLNSERISKGAAPSSPKQYARLEVAENFPVILGSPERRMIETGRDQREFFALPPGTLVSILDWGDKIEQPIHSDAIYKTMVDETKVLVLTDPHVGKELYVANMYIKVTE